MKKSTWHLLRNSLIVVVFVMSFVDFILFFSSANQELVRYGTIATIVVVLSIYGWSLHNESHLPKMHKIVRLMALIGAASPIALSLLFNFDIDSHTNLKIHNLMLIIVGMEILDIVLGND